MRYEENAESQPLLKTFEKIDHIGLSGDIQRRDSFVSDQDFRFERQGTRKANALALASRKGVREPIDALRVELDHRKDVEHPSSGGWSCHSECALEITLDYPPNGVPRVERGGGVLKNHLKMRPKALQGALGHPGDVDTINKHLSFTRLAQSENTTSDSRLPRARATDEPKSLAGSKLEIDSINSLRRAGTSKEAPALVKLPREIAHSEPEIDIPFHVFQSRRRFRSSFNPRQLEQLLRVYLAWICKELGGCSLLDKSACIEDDHLVRDIRDNAEVVGDQENTHISRLLQALQQCENRSLR